MTRCIMLDVDGVIVTGRPKDGRYWGTDLESDLGISMHQLSEVLFTPHWQAIVTGQQDLAETLDQCLPLISQSLTAADLMSYWFSMDARLDQQLLSDVAQLRSQGTPVYLATNQDHHRARYLMDQVGLHQHVDGMIYSAQIGAKKPDPAFYKVAEQITGRAPQDLMLIDDTPANVDAAIKAGWKGVHWTLDNNLLDQLEL